MSRFRNVFLFTSFRQMLWWQDFFFWQWNLYFLGIYWSWYIFSGFIRVIFQHWVLCSGQRSYKGVRVLSLVEVGAVLCDLSHVVLRRAGRSVECVLAPAFEDCVCPADCFVSPIAISRHASIYASAFSARLSYSSMRNFRTDFVRALPMFHRFVGLL